MYGNLTAYKTMTNFFPQHYFVPRTVDTGYVETVSDAPDRIYAQYRNKPKFVEWINIIKQLATGVASVADAVRVSYDIDAASGEMLNVIGRIVVADRSFMGKTQLYPGMCAAAENDPAQCGNDSQMCSALTIDQDSTMSDELYRLFIKSKIIKNNSDATIDSILYGMNFLLPDARVLRLVDGENMSFSIEFYGQITELERWALLNSSLIAKPQGVRFNGFLEGFDYVQCGDSSRQCGDSTTQCVGFIGV